MPFQKILFFLFISFSLTAQDYFPKNDGVKQTYKSPVALTNATIYISATQKIEKATLLFKDGKILAVGTNVTIPKNAVNIDATGKTIYPSFIDLFTEFGIQKPVDLPRGNFMPQYDSNREGYYWNDHVKPEYQAYENLNYDKKEAANFREIGFGTVLSQNNDGIIAGTGLIWTLNDDEKNEIRILKDKASQLFTFKKSKASKQSYPSSLMGSMALIRQVFYDADWYLQGVSKTKDFSLEAFNANKKLLQIFDAGDKLNSLRASKLGKEFKVNFLIKGSGNELEQLDEIKKTNATFILPLDFPEPYDVSNPYLANQVSLGDMKLWNQAPYNLKILAENNVNFILTSADVKDKKDFLKNLRKAVALGYPKEKALAALTEIPAQIANLSSSIGSLKNGSFANFLVVSGDVFDEKSIINENWIQGNQYILQKRMEDIRGTYDLTINNQKYDLKIEGEISKLNAKITKDSTKLASKLEYNEPWLNIIINSADTLQSKFTRLTGIKSENKYSGKAILENGMESSWSAVKTQEYVAKEQDKKAVSKPLEMLPVSYPNIAFGNAEKPKSETILFKNATVWTGEKEGILKDSDVLIENGKISKIGQNLSVSSGKTIDAKGKHLTAGIIDEHSHIAISNGVNEGGQNSSAEVTIEDVVNSEDINIYRNLAGGVTSSNLLHGSANPIGGRAAFIKLKWGYAPEEMIVKSAPKYIKFALGENVKQSNGGNNATNRFPQSRMGVEQVYEDYFTRALEYQKEWNAFRNNKSKSKTQPRFDLEMEVLSEILNKKRFITCHSYVQSEINMLMKLTERYGFKVQTFTHILEGYKVADKMAAHGVGGSTFSDWWAYKFEVRDAIPYNAALMNGEGVLVSINSDDAEMSRRLNQEAAKTVKYGNVPEVEAWNFVTLNPAKLLQVDDKVGSIKVGKDADVVLWSDNPLSIYAKVEKTIIEGVVFYEIEKEQENLNNIEKQRVNLINALIDAKNKGEKTQNPKKKKITHYHCDTLEE